MRIIGTFSEVIACQKSFPKASMADLSVIMNSRNFIRWYKKHSKIINLTAFIAPSVTIQLFGLIPGTSLFMYLNPAIAVSTDVQVSFWGGKGVILLHMLVVGFFTLVVSSFLKFTGRGDLIPLVAFVGGGIILYEVIGLFNDIYSACKTLMSV